MFGLGLKLSVDWRGSIFGTSPQFYIGQDQDCFAIEETNSKKVADIKTW